jgi:hypothetical protein
MADRVLDVRLDKAADKAVATAGRVGPKEDVVSHERRVIARLMTQLVLSRQHGEGAVEELEVVIGIVGAGSAGTKDRIERLARGVAPRSEGVKAEAAFVGGSGLLFF